MSADWHTITKLYDRGFLVDTKKPNPDWYKKYIHPDDQPYVIEVIKTCINEKKIYEIEHRVFAGRRQYRLDTCARNTITR